MKKTNKKSLSITPEKLKIFYMLRDTDTPPNKNEITNLPTFDESLNIYRKHSSKFGIGGKGTLKISDFE